MWVFSTTATWNCRGRQRKASAASTQVAHQTGSRASKAEQPHEVGVGAHRVAASPPGESKAKKATAPPTRSAAASLTTNSVATASIRPRCGSLALTLRTPKSTAKAAIAAATISVVPPGSPPTAPSAARASASKLMVIAFSCSAK